MRRNNRRNRNLDRKNFQNSYYNSSSVAYDYPIEKTYYEPRRKKSIENRKKHKKIQIKTVREQSVHSFRVYFTVFLIFCCSVFIIMSNATVTDKKSQIASLKDELRQIEEDNSNLKTELTKSLDIEEIERLASERLGMQMPESYQIVYINVPQQSYTVKHENTSNNEDLKSFNIIEIIKNILEVD